MSSLRKVAPVAVALAFAALTVVPAAAQDWRDDGYPPYGYEHNWRSGAWDDRPRYGYDDGFDTGIREYAVCPAGYHLGRSGRLCWPD